MRNRRVLRPGLSPIGANINASSPVRQVVELTRGFFAADPDPDINSSDARSASLLAGAHLLDLVDACALLNAHGLHSAAVTLLSSQEDAIDCFAAVATVPGAAKLWIQRKLRPSEATKL